MKLVMWNRQHEVVFGYDHAEMNGKSVFDFHPIENHESVRKTLADVDDTRHAVMSTELVTKDGCRIPYLLNGAEFIRSDGRYLIGVGTDISDLVRAESALRESDRVLKLAQEVARVGYYITDINTGVWSSSAILDEIFGIDDDFVKNLENWRLMVVPEFRQNLWEHYRQTIEERTPFAMDYQIIRPSDGQVRWVWSHGQLECDDTGRPVRVVGTIQDIAERKRVEEALALSRAEIRAIYDNAPVMMCVVDADSLVLYANSEFAAFTGITQQELVGSRACGVLGCVHAQEDPRGCGYGASCAGCPLRKALDDTLQTGNGHKSIEYRTTVCRGSETRDVVMLAATAPIPSGMQIRVLLCLQDITELKRSEQDRVRLQEQLHQALKLESVGRLAGGVAHDFNNMLSVIIGHTQIVMEQLDSDHPLYDDLTEIYHAAERSAELTRQLLAFARKQTVIAQVINLNESVENVIKMLERLIGEGTRLVWEPQPDIWPVKVDQSHIDQILINLCVNARDAISEKGLITIKTHNVAVDESLSLYHPELQPGEYVALTVSDNGHGMDQATQAHMFEPFFTTKGVGQGTGLGLATVYGSVKQNHGHIEVNSQPGCGTTIAVYLPRYLGETQAEAGKSTAMPAAAGHETILLVEDESAILRMTTSLLERMGYNVIAAGTPSEALRLARQNQGHIDLLFTDVVMPHMNGWQLAKLMKELHPKIKVLFMSGYPAEVISRSGMNIDQVHFLAKPFLADDLAHTVREVLEASGSLHLQDSSAAE